MGNKSYLFLDLVKILSPVADLTQQADQEDLLQDNLLASIVEDVVVLAP